MVVYYVVFGVILSQANENYPVFLLTGLIPWMWFLKAVSTSSSSILGGQQLMLQVGISPIVFPLVSLTQVTVKQLPVLGLLLAFAWLQGLSPGIHWFELLPVILVQGLLTLVIACAIAAAIPFVRDLANLVPTGLMFLMFVSGIFYDYQTLSPQIQDAFLLNPIAFLLVCYRDILINGGLSDVPTLLTWGIASLILFGLLLLCYQRLRYTYPRILMQ